MAQRRIWLMDADGANKRPLTSDDAYRDERPQWSRDGETIVFARIDREDQASLWSMPASGGPATKLTDLSRPPDLDVPLWFGYYGHVDWNSLYAWWQP